MKISKLATLALAGVFTMAFATDIYAQDAPIQKSPEAELHSGPIGDGPIDVDDPPPPLLSEKETALSEISLYPNPGNGMVNIEIPKGEPVKVKVYDVWGNLHFQTEVKLNAHQKFRLDLSNSKAGVYLIQINTETLRYQKW